MSVNSKMTALADEIRVLSGTTEAMGLDDMKAHVGEANDEVASQVELLAQVVAALEGKAGSGGGSGGAETVTVTLAPSAPMWGDGKLCYLDGNGVPQIATVAGTYPVLKNSIMVANSGDGVHTSDFTSIWSYQIYVTKVFQATNNGTIKM